MGLFITPWLSAFGQNVRPSDGAKLYFYEAGTSTPKTVYSDPDETTPLSNPVVAAANGRFSAIFVSGTFKVVLKDKNDVTQETLDNVSSALDPFTWQGDFDSSTNAGDYPSGGNRGDIWRVTEKFVLNAASGSHQLYVYDFIVANKAGATAVNADWNIIKGKDWLIDEDDFASDSDTLAPSQQSTKAYIGTYVASQILDEDDFASDSTTKAPSQQSAAVYMSVNTAQADYYIDSGSANAYVLAKPGGSSLKRPTAYADGLRIRFRPDNANTQASTVNVESIGIVDLKRPDGNDAEIGDLTTDRDIECRYDQTSGAFLLHINLATQTNKGISYLPDSRISIAISATVPLLRLDFGVGRFAFDDGSGEAISAAYEKDISASWAAGDNNGMLDAGSIAPSTWYYLYAIYNPASGLSDYLSTVSFGSPTLPAGYTKKKYIGPFKTTGISQLVQSTWDHLGMGELQVTFPAPILDFTQTAQVLIWTNQAINTPAKKVKWLATARLGQTAGNSQFLLQNDDISGFIALGVYGITGTVFSNFEIMTKNDGTIDYQRTGGGLPITVETYTNSFIDYIGY